ncbi:MAG: twin-arginine translocase subunit TatC [Gemmatimonadota bacterium]
MPLRGILGRGADPGGEMPFLDHLEELRWRILKAIIAIGVGTIIGWVVVQQFGVMEILIRPVRPLLTGEGLAFFSPVTPFFITLKLALVVGLILATPIVVHQIWAFLSPGLTKSERRVIVPSLYFGLVLFCAGVALAYFMVLPLALRFLAGFQPEYLEAVYEVGAYLAFVTKLLIAFGVAFELPVVILILSALGLVTPKFMREKRRHAIVAITILATMLTPGDLPSTILLMIPLMILYEGSIFLSAMIQRRRGADEVENRLLPDEEPPAGAVGIQGPWDESSR